MKIHMITTYRCNLSCIMCDLPIIFKNSKDLPLEKIKKIVREAKNLGFNDLTLTGGEPLLRNDIFEIIKYAKLNNFKINLTTNASLIYKKIVKKIVKYGPDIIVISLDGPKLIHDKIRGKGTFDQTIDAIKKLKNKGVSITIASVIIKQNYRHLCEIIKIVHNLGIGIVWFQPFRKMHLLDQNRKINFNLNKDDIKRLKKELINLKKICKIYKIKTNSHNYLNAIPSYFLNEKIKLVDRCVIPSTSFTVDLYGNILPCWGMPEINFGNITNNSIKNIWNSEKFNKFRLFALNGKCKGCMCGGYDPEYFKKID
jgi:MoaA/NifB/PqqE/SkfB family radical SAM enzyme